MMLISQAVTMVDMNSILAILDVMFYWSIITLTIRVIAELTTNQVYRRCREPSWDYIYIKGS